MSDRYAKTFEQLETVASKFWPPELSEIESASSVIPLLLKTQDQFINIIGLETSSLQNFLNVVELAGMPPNLFVKHLVILADFGGEMLKRVSKEFHRLFPNGELHYTWKGEQQVYKFSALPNRKLNNRTLRIDGKALFKPHPFDELKKDAIVMLLFGSGHVVNDDDIAPALAKCETGKYLGKPEELAKFVKQRYIWVSRITGGALSNRLGQIAQDFVADYVKRNLGLDKITVNKGGRLPNVSHTDSITGRMTSFDIVVTDDTKYVAIEVTECVNNNETRKSENYC